MKINKETGAPTRYRVVKEETGLSKKGTSRHFSRPNKPKKSTLRVHVPSATSRPRPLNRGVTSPQARSPGLEGRRSAEINNARDNNTGLDIDESSILIDVFQEAHYNAYREQYDRRPGEQLVLHPQQKDASQDPYIYRPEETAVDKVLAELDKFDLYDTIDAIAEVVGPKKDGERKEEPVESPASKAVGSWRNSLEQRPPILTSHRDAYSYRTRGQQALSPKSSLQARSLHKLEGNIAESSTDCMEEPGPVPTYGFHPPAKKKNLVYVQSGVKQGKKSKRVTKDVASVGCVDTGVCNALCTDFPGIVDVSDANSLDGEELGELENQHARQIKVDRTWVESLHSTIKAAAASKDDRVSAVDTLRTEFNVGPKDYTGFRKSAHRGNDGDIDKEVQFGRRDTFANGAPPTAPNPLWHLFK